jgi:hypothetical protein
MIRPEGDPSVTRIDQTWHLIKRTLASQRTARSNAAEAIAVLGRRREERTAVAAYLHTQRTTSVLERRVENEDD